jgi:phage FluMu protein Com
MDTRPVTSFEWRCTRCGALLGVEVRGRMHLKYKTAQYVVAGVVTAVCRRCEMTNETFCPRDDAHVAP